MKSKAKPFPWRCPRCMKESVQPTTIAYTASRTDSGNLEFIEIPALNIPKCEECGELLFTNSVDEQIQEAFRKRKEADVTAK